MTEHVGIVGSWGF